jgi:hypothetical protein
LQQEFWFDVEATPAHKLDEIKATKTIKMLGAGADPCPAVTARPALSR